LSPDKGVLQMGRLRRALLVCLFGSMAGLNIYTLWQARTLIAHGYSDFVHFYAAGQLTRAGHGSELFNPSEQLAAQRPLSEAVKTRGRPIVYMHPPFEALLFAPFSYLPYVHAFLLWDLVSILALLAVPILLRRELRVLQDIPAHLWLLIVFGFFPVFALLLQGQDDAILLLLITLAYLELRRKADFRAGGWLGLALIRPQFVLPLIFILLASGPGVAAGFAVTGLGLGILTVLIFGWPFLGGYAQHLWSTEQTLNPGGNMPNLHGFLSSILAHTAAPAVIAALVFLGSAALLIIAAQKWRRHRSDNPELAYSLAIVTIILVSYHAFAQDLTLLILPMVLQGDSMLREKFRPATAFILLPIVVLFLNPLCYVMAHRGYFYLFALGLLGWFAITATGATEMPGQAAGHGIP
jgi:Glycosyltransferase family 87